MTTILLCLTMANSPLAPAKPRIISDKWTLIDGGKRWKQTAIYSDGTRKVFVTEIPKMRP